MRMEIVKQHRVAGNKTGHAVVVAILLAAKPPKVLIIPASYLMTAMQVHNAVLLNLDLWPWVKTQAAQAALYQMELGTNYFAVVAVLQLSPLILSMMMAKEIATKAQKMNVQQ